MSRIDIASVDWSTFRPPLSLVITAFSCVALSSPAFADTVKRDKKGVAYCLTKKGTIIDPPFTATTDSSGRTTCTAGVSHAVLSPGLNPYTVGEVSTAPGTAVGSMNPATAAGTRNVAPGAFQLDPGVNLAPAATAPAAAVSPARPSAKPAAEKPKKADQPR